MSQSEIEIKKIEIIFTSLAHSVRAATRSVVSKRGNPLAQSGTLPRFDMSDATPRIESNF